MASGHLAPKKATAAAVSACTWPCAGGAFARCNRTPTPPRKPNSTHGLRCAPNRLFEQPKPTQANRMWVSDITYLPLVKGFWTNLCAFQNVASKHMVGWQMGAAVPAELVTTVLQ